MSDAETFPKADPDALAEVMASDGPLITFDPCPACVDPRCNEECKLLTAETILPDVPAKSDTAKRLTVAGRKVQEWTAERDRLIRLALREGGSLREVGALAGLTHTAVKLIDQRG